MCLCFREVPLTHQSVKLDQTNSRHQNTNFLKVCNSKWATETFIFQASLSWLLMIHWVSWLQRFLVHSYVSTHVLLRRTNMKIPQEPERDVCLFRHGTKAFTDNWIKQRGDKQMMQTLRSFVYLFISTAPLSTSILNNTMFHELIVIYTILLLILWF